MITLTHHHLLHALDPARERAVWMDAVSKEPIQELHDKMQAQASDELAQLVQALPKEARHSLSTELLGVAPARAIIERAAALRETRPRKSASRGSAWQAFESSCCFPCP